MTDANEWSVCRGTSAVLQFYAHRTTFDNLRAHKLGPPSDLAYANPRAIR